MLGRVLLNLGSMLADSLSTVSAKAESCWLGIGTETHFTPRLHKISRVSVTINKNKVYVSITTEKQSLCQYYISKNRVYVSIKSAKTESMSGLHQQKRVYVRITSVKTGSMSVLCQQKQSLCQYHYYISKNRVYVSIISAKQSLLPH
jgi:hypothetical protein